MCQRWCVTKWCLNGWCVKYGRWRCGVWKIVRERWWVAKLGVKDGVWRMASDKVVCEKWCVTKWCVKEGASKLVPRLPHEKYGCTIAPRLPRKTKVNFTKCHTCHVKRRWMLFVPRLPCETKVDISFCNTYQAKCGGVAGAQSGCEFVPTMWNRGGCRFLPRLSLVSCLVCVCVCVCGCLCVCGKRWAAGGDGRKEDEPGIHNKIKIKTSHKDIRQKKFYTKNKHIPKLSGKKPFYKNTF